MPNKIGILTYYWPPSGGSGVQRWLRFSNELVKLGYDVHVFTFKNPKYPIVDNELLKKVDDKIKVNFISGFELPNFLTNKNSNSSESYKNSGVKSFVRELFFFPDSRKYLISPSVKYIKKYIEKTPLNCLISSGPPHSMHLVGLKLKKKTNLKWIADFRDPWSNFVQNKFLNKLESTRIKHENKENLVLKFSDAILTTSKSLNKEFKLKNHNTFYTPSGFESFIKPKAYNKFRILYAGSMKEFQNPINLWIALKELIESDISFKDLVEIVLIGNIDKNIIENKEFRLLQNTKIISYLSKDNLDKEISISELLLVCSVNVEGSNDIIPGKFYHYLSSGKKILGISNRGTDLEKIIKETKSGMSFSYDNHADLKNYIYKCFSDYKDGKVNNQKTDDKFLSLNIAKNISEIISKL
tara:strand:+ start:4678 stop:5913 length:1236 start_codon:yes stop_codon:yes gene_type:complete